MNKCKLYYFVIIFSGLLSSCQSNLPIGYSGTAFDELKPGAKLVLKQGVFIPSGLAAIYLQDGQIVTESVVRVRQPHCKFEVNTISEAVTKISADEFDIMRYSMDTDYVMQEVQRFAALSLSISVFGDSGGGPTAKVYVIEMFLKSARQPDVLRISCGHWEDPMDGNYLTLSQVKQALGSIMEFKQPD